MRGVEYFSGQFGRLIVIRLDPGDLLLESVEEVARVEGLEAAVVISGIGTLDRCYLHTVTTTGYPPREQRLVWEGVPLELLSLQGIIAGGRPHLHAVVSDTKGACGGHVEEGCRVLYLAEIAILKVDGLALARLPDEHGIGRLRKRT